MTLSQSIYTYKTNAVLLVLLYRKRAFEHTGQMTYDSPFHRALQYRMWDEINCLSKSKVLNVSQIEIVSNSQSVKLVTFNNVLNISWLNITVVTIEKESCLVRKIFT